MAGYRQDLFFLSFCFCVFKDRDEVVVDEVDEKATKERNQYPAILTEQA